MTVVLETTEGEPPLPERPAPQAAGVNAGRRVPAAALTDRALADWVRTHGVSVTARGEHDLDLVRFHHIRAVQVVYRCGPDRAATSRAVGLGVSRFIGDTAEQMARVGDCVHTKKYLYLDDQAPLMLGDRWLKVIGLHTDVKDAGNPAAWASAARLLMSRSAVLAACGSPVNRIDLSGGPIQEWLGDATYVGAVVAAVDEALGDECGRWNLQRPAVTVAALTA
ncbi:hypothetical protein ACQI4L_10425 [Mycolicibacterium litorale]|uniref:hypothetical protein n=1 Tax=Mycolicibacterium litorale TaxID=758802 RepID=UPI003CF1DFA2